MGVDVSYKAKIGMFVNGSSHFCFPTRSLHNKRFRDRKNADCKLRYYSYQYEIALMLIGEKNL